MKKIHSSVFEGALYCLLFAAAAVYVEARIRPQVLYYWNPELFLKTFGFFHDIALLPGGITTYADKFLFQLNALPWLGALSTVSFACLAGVFANRIYSALTGIRFSFFIVVPLFFVLCTLNQFRIIPLTKLLSALVVANVFIHLQGKNALLRVGVFFITSCFFILIVHDLYWLFAALCIVSEVLRRDDRWAGVLYAVLASAILFIDHRYLYLLHPKVESTSTPFGVRSTAPPLLRRPSFWDSCCLPLPSPAKRDPFPASLCCPFWSPVMPTSRPGCRVPRPSLACFSLRRSCRHSSPVGGR